MFRPKPAFSALHDTRAALSAILGESDESFETHPPAAFRADRRHP